MDHKVCQSIVRRHASLPAGARLQAYRKAAGKLTGPLSAWERKIGEALGAAAMAKPRTWYHRGLAGRGEGDLILPPEATGASAWKTASWAGRDRVYITHQAGGAEFFAHWNERLGQESRVYVVEPQGELTADPEALRFVLLLQEDPLMRERHLAHIGDLLSRFTCEAAKVVAVLEVEGSSPTPSPGGATTNSLTSGGAGASACPSVPAAFKSAGGGTS